MGPRWSVPCARWALAVLLVATLARACTPSQTHFCITAGTKLASHPNTGGDKDAFGVAGHDEELYVVEGVTYTFELAGTASNYFYLSTHADGGTLDTHYTDGVSASPIQGDGSTFTWTPCATCGGAQLYYGSPNKTRMGWRVHVLAFPCEPSLFRACVGVASKGAEHADQSGSAMAYTINGAQDTALTMYQGQKFVFQLDVPAAHPLTLTSATSKGGDGGASTLTVGELYGAPAAGVGAVLEYVPSTNTPATVAFQSTADEAMGWTAAVVPHVKCVATATKFCVTVQRKTPAHPFYGMGSPHGFVVNGVEGGEMVMVEGTKYTVQVDLVDAAFGFHLSTSKSGGDSGAATYGAMTSRVQPLAVQESIVFTPTGHVPLLYYQSEEHEYMGGRVVVQQACRALCYGPSTATDDTAAGLTEGLLAHWSFDDDALPGTLIGDSSGAPLHKLDFAPRPMHINMGVQGRALSFNGNDEDATLQLAPSVPPAVGLSGVTVGMWFSVAPLEADTTMVLFESSNDGVTVTLRLRYLAGSDAFKLAHSIVHTPTSTGFEYVVEVPVEVAAWHYTALRWSPNSRSVWFDGEKQPDAFEFDNGNPRTLRLFDGASVAKLGNDVGGVGDHFMGVLDEVSVWQRALSDAELAYTFAHVESLRVCTQACRKQCTLEGAAATLGNDLFAYYPMEDAGSVLHDVSAAFRHAGAGEATSVRGVVGRARALDGVNDVLSLALHRADVNDFTVQGWVALHMDDGDTYDGYLLYAADADETDALVLRIERANDDKMQPRLAVELRYAGGATTWAAIDVSAWADARFHHVAVRRSGATVSVWIDGADVGAPSTQTGDASTAGNLFSAFHLIGNEPASLGVAGATVWLDADVDEWAVWLRALADDDVSDLYTLVGHEQQQLGACASVVPANNEFSDNDADGALTGGLVAYWPFDEATATDLLPVGPAAGVGVVSGDVEVGDGPLLGGPLLGKSRYFASEDAVVRVGGSGSVLADFSVSLWFALDFTTMPWNENTVLFSSTGDAELCQAFDMRVFQPSLGGGQIDVKMRAMLRWACDEDAVIELTPAMQSIGLHDWNHVVVQREGPTLRMFMNNVLLADTTDAALASGFPLLVAGATVGQSSNVTLPHSIEGWIDEVAVWGRVLSPAEVALVYNGGDAITLEPRCGNGIVERGEECDNGLLNGNGAGACRSTCELAACGDGIVDVGEQCDAGDDNSDVTANACRTTCVWPTCGDGVVDAGEECDDANLQRGDSCSSTCVNLRAHVTEHNTCTLDASGDVRCWGEGLYGLLGLGVPAATADIGNDELPAVLANVDVGGVTVDMCAGHHYFCALNEEHEVRCWGRNANGEQGRSNSPVGVGAFEKPGAKTPVPVLSEDEQEAGKYVRHIACGLGHVCASTNDGDVRCWGLNTNGQCGVRPDGASLRLADNAGEEVWEHTLLTPQHTGVRVRKLALGSAHTCALSYDNRVRCWGRALTGERVGYETVQHMSTLYENRITLAGDVPVVTQGERDAGTVPVDLVSGGGDHTCALLSTGALRCWGLGGNGRLGYGNGNDVGGVGDIAVTTAGDVSAGATVVRATVGPSQTCAVLTGGSLRCWGRGDTGVLGHGASTDVAAAAVPSTTAVVDVGGAVQNVAVGASHACAVMHSGTLKCWGYNPHGELGLGNDKDVATGGGATPSDVDAVPFRAPHARVMSGDLPAEVELDVTGGRKVTLSVPDDVFGTNSTVAARAALLVNNFRSTAPELMAGVDGFEGVGSPGVSPPTTALTAWVSTLLVGEYRRPHGEGFQWGTLSPPLTAEFSYSEVDEALFQVNSFALYRWSGGEWAPNSLSCGAGTLDAGARTFSANLCAAGQYQLFAAGQALPTLTSVTPAHGLAQGNTDVVVNGTGFIETGVIQVRFGSEVVSGAYDDELDVITARSPAVADIGSPDVHVEVALNGFEFTDAELDFHYYAEPQVVSTNVAAGPQSGATEVRVSGTNFFDSGAITCRFAFVDANGDPLPAGEDDAQVVPGTLADGGSTVVCVTGEFARAGTTRLSVSFNGQQYGASYATFVVTTAAPVARVVPTVLPLGHTVAMVRVEVAAGSNFTDTGATLRGVFWDTSVTESVDCVYVDKSTVTCPAPSWEYVATVQFKLSLNGQQYEETDAVLQFFDAEVTGISPASGPVGGATLVTLSGTGFPEHAHDLAVQFTDGINTVTVPATLKEVTTNTTDEHGVSTIADVRVLEATTAAFDFLISLPHVVTLRVSFNGEASYADVSRTVTFTFYANPAVSKLQPTSGPITGATVVTLFGSGVIATGEAKCRFGESLLREASVNELDNTVTCTSPVVAYPDVLTLEVSLNGQQYTSSGLEFRFYAEPTVLAIDPPYGPAEGNTTVRMTGTEFVDTSEIFVRFGDLVVPGTMEGDETIVFASPLFGAASLVTVEMALNNQQFVTAPTGDLQFQYFSVFALFPRMGSIAGGTLLNILGAGFSDSGNIVCRFGSPAFESPATYLSPSQVSCVTPAVNFAGDVPVSLAMDGVNFADESLVPLFEFHDVPTITGVSPRNGPFQGGTTVTVTGDNFAHYGEDVMCKFGFSIVVGVFDALNDAIVCVSPPGSGTVALEVSFNQADFTHEGITYTFSSVNSLHPVSGAVTGSTPVTVSGEGFANGPDDTLLCRFEPDGEVVEAQFESAEKLICMAPAMATAGMRTVEVTVNGDDYTVNGREFFFYDVPTVTLVTPRNAPMVGNVEAAVQGADFVDLDTIKLLFSGSQDTVVPATYERSDKLTVTVPAAFNAGPVTVSVALNGLEFLGAAPLTYFSVLDVDSDVVPQAGEMTGGTQLQIRVDGGYDASWGEPELAFGDARVPVTFNAETSTLVATVPDFAFVGAGFAEPVEGVATPVPVYLSIAPERFVRLHEDFSYTFYEQPVVQSLFPLEGAARGNTLVTIHGQGFVNTGSIQARFVVEGAPAQVVDVQFHNSTVMYLHTPGSPVSVMAAVEITFNGLEYVATLEYEYVGMNTVVIGLSPASGPVTGGTDVTVTGLFPVLTDPDSAHVVMYCKFGQMPRVVARRVLGDPNNIVCAAPPTLESGPVFVEVSITNTIFTENEREFLYFTPPYVAHLDPPSGPQMGGELITIFGNDFFKPNGIVEGSAEDLAAQAAAAAALAAQLAEEEAAQVEQLRSVARGTMMPRMVAHVLPRATEATAEEPVTEKAFGQWQCIFEKASRQIIAVVDAVLVAPDRVICPTPASPPESAAAYVYVTFNGETRHAPAQTDRYEFLACPPGTTTVDFRKPCQNCAPGWYNSVRGGRCELCNQTSFGPSEGMSECMSCPENTVSVKGATSKAECRCVFNHYRVPNGNGECAECPRGARCEDGNLEALEDWWWRTADTSEPLFIPCILPAACPGGPPQTCEGGYEGRLCSECAGGFYQVGDFCETCPKHAWVRILIAFLVLLLMVPVFVLFGKNLKQYVPALAIGINYWQIVALFGTFRLQWPEMLQRVFNIFDLLNFNIELLSSECSVDMGYKGQWVTTIILPWVIAFCFFLTYRAYIVYYNFLQKHGQRLADTFGASDKATLMMERMRAIADRPEQVEKFLNTLINAFILILTVSYIFLTAKAVELWDCSQQEDGQWTLDAHPSLACYERWWWQLMPVAVISTAFYGIGIPIIMARVLYSNSHHLYEERVVERFGFLINHYKHDFFYWEIAIMARELVFDMAKLFFTAHQLLGVGSAICMLIVCLLAQAKLRPYRKSAHNLLEFTLLSVSVFALLSGLMFFTDKFPRGARDALAIVVVVLLLGGSALVFYTIFAEVVSLHSARKLAWTKEGKLLMSQYNHCFTVDAVPVCVRWLKRADVNAGNRFHRVMIKLNDYVQAHYTYRKREPMPTFTFDGLAAFCEGAIKETSISYVYRWLKDEASAQDKADFCFVVGSIMQQRREEQAQTRLGLLDRVAARMSINRKRTHVSEADADEVAWLVHTLSRNKRLGDGTIRFLVSWILAMQKGDVQVHERVARMISLFLARGENDDGLKVLSTDVDWFTEKVDL